MLTETLEGVKGPHTDRENTLLIRMDHYFWPKFAELDLTHESGQAFESGSAQTFMRSHRWPDWTHESGPALQIWAKNNGPF